MSPTPNNKVKFEKSIDFLQDTIQKMHQNGETSNEIKRNMDERIEKIISEVSVDICQLPEGSHSGTYGIGVGMIKSTYDLFISHSKAWKAATAVAGYYVETTGKPNRGTFHRFDNTPSRPASPRVGISNKDDSPIRMGRLPARLPPRPNRPKPAEPPPKTPWDEWAEAEAEETKKWGEDLE
ncbi:hypothetical protein Clacol_004910 [Clathrus columnatus]|uniref:Uncharacterized protein n=1 Tax=Clathrus columnatus TaxID=1419009 RepID=A0AAV5AB28_9AGAM|nr:hypothetical protein Clacol_004910 [Clathrus columnatus]